MAGRIPTRRAAPAGPDLPAWCEVGAYCTDGERLFEVVRVDVLGEVAVDGSVAVSTTVWCDDASLACEDLQAGLRLSPSEVTATMTHVDPAG